MYKLTDTFLLILLIFAVFLSVAYTTLNKLFAVFLYIIMIMVIIIIIIIMTEQVLTRRLKHWEGSFHSSCRRQLVDQQWGRHWISRQRNTTTYYRPMTLEDDVLRTWPNHWLSITERLKTKYHWHSFRVWVRAIGLGLVTQLLLTQDARGWRLENVAEPLAVDWTPAPFVLLLRLSGTVSHLMSAHVLLSQHSVNI